MLHEVFRPTRKLAQIYLARNDTRSAERVCRSILKECGIEADTLTRCVDLPPLYRHVQTMHLLSTIAECQLRQGNLDAAERMYHVTLDLFDGGFPVQNAWTQADLAQIDMARGRVRTAAERLRGVKDALEERFGTSHYRVRQLHADLAECERRLAAGSTTQRSAGR